MQDHGKTFARLLVAHDRSLRQYIALFLPRRADVEEVLQQTAAALWEKFDEFDTSREFLPWATRFAYFEVLNYRKERARSRVFYSEDVMQALADTQRELSVELQFRESILQECLSELGSEDHLLLQRRYSEEATIKSLSEETGRTVKSLYRRLDRIRELLATCIDRKTQASGQF
ncbi:MAG: sigma-70 family RNA polymerase sigma factor [Planctomycetaceae bacterium]